MCCQTVFGSPAAGQAKVTRSVVRTVVPIAILFTLKIRQEKQSNSIKFVAVLERRSNTIMHFVAEIIENFFIIKCLTIDLTVKLSIRQALQWVRYTRIDVKTNKLLAISVKLCI